ncbi:acryloyl-CoA reductase [Paenibacillus lactis]|uniref:Quinone oxidoreductase, YhdH/YhfP family n=2 Tax=Paenibacillus lactis TaxID=228574 RepID=G4HBF8_9BACL|nr:acryloyl-CoA reductase [Paenibacillus lactis]EHB67267.1 quinone oxidoreductase, YhdH/YhfP family [Paenibacillus lactis 154]MBP1894522.1 putative YhdH/YhfP family quinone oxidoreductase [Paenibacillus lactis]MCM3496100.1 acryloyl-CoA reductase [Paenibacillus lactis]HAF98629.1 oxidoreductase [Paenibacillus lactis]
MNTNLQFQAFVLRQDDQGGVQSAVESLRLDQLPEGDVLVQVSHSGVNYKDGLASIPNSSIVRRYPFIPGIDLAGKVVESTHPGFKPGDGVLCTGYELGVSHEGGFSQYARVKGDWLLHLPDGLSPRDAMAIGTAGFTAALSIAALIRNGLSNDQGPVLVTGATGGVGSFAVSILSRLGYSVTASTGKTSHAEWLKRLGAEDVLSREETAADSGKALSSQKWAAVVDPVGGSQLGSLLKSVRYGGSIAVSGMTGGGAFETTVFPFILRGINLLGIDSVFCPLDVRTSIWEKLADEWKPETVLAEGITEYGLTDLPGLLQTILAGEAVGRSVVRL